MSSSSQPAPLILYVEDDDATAYLVQNALAYECDSLNLVRLSESAAEFVDRKAGFVATCSATISGVSPRHCSRPSRTDPPTARARR